MGKGQKSKRVPPLREGKAKPSPARLSLPFPTDDVAEERAEIIKRNKRELQKNLKETRLH